MSNPFGMFDSGVFDSGVFDDFFKGGAKTSTTNKNSEKGLPWRAKRIDGELFVPLSQVVELLEQNNVLPAVRKGLEKHLENKE